MNYIILAAGRSGSTMLVNCLSSHSNVRCHHEPFNQHGWHDQIQHYSNSTDALKHLDKHGLSIPLNKKVISLIQKKLRLHRGRIIIDPFKNENKITSEGFKITWAQTSNMFEPMKMWISSKEEIKVIFLYRYDYLARFVSYQLANVSGVWNSSHKKYSYEPFNISAISFKKFCDSESRIENKMLEMLSSLNRNVSFLSYEALVDNPLELTNKQFHFLGCR